MKDKKLLIVSHKKHYLDQGTGRFYTEGGFVPITNEIAKHFQKVLLAVPVKDEQSSRCSMKYSDNLEIVPLPFYEKRVGLVANLPRYLAVITGATKKADIIYAMGPGDVGAVGMAVARTLRKPMFTSFDTDRAQRVKVQGYGAWKTAYKYGFNQYLLNPYFRAVAKSYPSFITGDMFLGSYPHWHQWVKTTHLSHDIPPYVRRHIDAEQPHVVFAGRLSPEKNIPVLIKAIGNLHHRGLKPTLTILGDGAQENQLKALVADLGLEASVRFQEHIEPEAVLTSNFLGADVLVLPSKEERQGKVLVEAMSCSIPIIASRAGGIPSIIKDGENGLLFDPDNADELASKIEIVASDAALAERITQNGYAFAARNSLDQGVEKLVNIVAEFFSEPHVATKHG